VSNALETIVRPSQTEVSQPQPYFTPGQAGTPNVVLKIGRGGSGGKVLNGSISLSSSAYMQRYENEKSVS
jgi:hypothetical protein